MCQFESIFMFMLWNFVPEFLCGKGFIDYTFWFVSFLYPEVGCLQYVIQTTSVLLTDTTILNACLELSVQ